MKPNVNLVFVAGLAAALSSCATRPPSEAEGGPRYYYANSGSVAKTPSAPAASPPAAASAEQSETPWPRSVASGSTTVTIYEPQVDSWDGREIVARNAVGIQRAGQQEPTYGVVTLKAITLVDKSSRKVSLENIRLEGGDFPSARESSQEFMKTLRESFPKTLDGLSLDRLQISLVVAPEQLRGSTQLNNTPPKIIFSSTPEILVYIDGPPAYRPVTGSELQRVINTRVLLVKDKDGQHYLHVWDGYLISSALDGSWTVATSPPEGAAEAEKQALASPTPVDLLNTQAEGSTNALPSLSKNAAPKIYIATQPSELIVFDGEPNFAPINGTHLLYVANTTANVFRLLTDQQTYVLISGRWFRAPSLDGPWQFVPADHLASDFANIPDNSPKENVKASVPGTQQATEALLANSIPDSTKVSRTTQMRPPQIDGPPDFRPIGGTPLYYVANSGTPIIKVDERSWYSCENGVWYSAASISGPWTVADSVPAVIYTIPPSSPLHYLTYVHVYGSNSEVVYTGYTPGYWGTEVEDGVVVYGSGYYYSPWVGAVWYGYPVSWGFGWGPCWNPWDDWCFAFGFGWGWYGGWGCHPWCGPGHHGLVATRRPESFTTSRSVYARQGRTTPGTRSIARSESRAGYARAYNSRTGTMAAGQRAGVQNVRNHNQSHSSASSVRSTRPLDTRTGNISRYGATSGNLLGGSSFNRGTYGPNFPGRDHPGSLNGYPRAGGPAHSGSAPGHSEGGRSIAGGGGRSGGGESHSSGGGGQAGGGGAHGGGGGGGGGHAGGGGGGGRGQR